MRGLRTLTPGGWRNRGSDLDLLILVAGRGGLRVGLVQLARLVVGGRRSLGSRAGLELADDLAKMIIGQTDEQRSDLTGQLRVDPSQDRFDLGSREVSRERFHCIDEIMTLKGEDKRITTSLRTTLYC